jgi:hypothetical protein
MSYILRSKNGLSVEINHSEIVSFEKYGNGTILILNRNGKGLSRQSIDISFAAFSNLYNS